MADRTRRARGQIAHATGMGAEAAARAALEGNGWTILAQRLRTKAGEIDIVADKEGLLAIVEVKSRPTHLQASMALTSRQQARLIAACDIVLIEHPDWGPAGVRFDVLLVDAQGCVRRIADAFRHEG